MAKINQFINKSLAKDVENGYIVQELPEVEFEGRMCFLFTPISPTHCIICGSPLKRNEYYDRFAISSYGIIRCPVSYWICSNPNCKKRDFVLFTGTIQKSAESAEARRENNISLRLSAVNLFCHDSFIQDKLKSHQIHAPYLARWLYENVLYIPRSNKNV